MTAARDDGGQAFPGVETLEPGKYTVAERHVGGMSLRDYFAAAALPTIHRTAIVLAQLPESWYSFENAAVAREAYALADAMLAERSKP